MKFSDVHYARFSATDLVIELAKAQAKWPGLTLSRSGNGIGDLCVYDHDGEYVAFIRLGNPPELVALPDDDGQS